MRVLRIVACKFPTQNRSVKLLVAISNYRQQESERAIDTSMSRVKIQILKRLELLIYSLGFEAFNFLLPVAF
jgi:hypothetical protein